MKKLNVILMIAVIGVLSVSQANAAHTVEGEAIWNELDPSAIHCEESALKVADQKNSKIAKDDDRKTGSIRAER